MAKITIPNLLAGASYSFQVSAQDGTDVSPWSPALVASTNADTIPPVTPAAPAAIGNATYSSIQVTCSMLDNLGHNLASDMEFFEVYIDVTSTITPTKTGSSANYYGNIQCAPTYTGNTPIPCNGTFMVAATRPNDASTSTNASYWCAVIAVDSSGNRSPLSATTAIGVGLINNLSVGYASITDANVQTLSVTKLIAGSGVVNNFSVYSTLTIGTSGTTGVIQSSDFVSNTSVLPVPAGWQISVGGLQINTGTITSATFQTAPHLSVGGATVGVQLTATDTDRIKFFSGDVNEIANGYIRAGVVGGLSPQPFISIRSGDQGSTFDTRGGNCFISMQSPQGPAFGAGAAPGLMTVQIPDGAAGFGQLQLNVSNILLEGMVGGITFTGSSGVLNFGATTQTLNLLCGLTLPGGSTNPLTIAGLATTASAANVFVGGAGIFQKSTSSKRYKSYIKDIDLRGLDPLSMRPVMFKDKTEVKELGKDNAPQHWGLIAEEVHDLGFTELIHYDLEGKPDGIQYDYIAPILIPVIRNMRDRIDVLEALTNKS